jgi:hypothetical protein
MSTPNDERITLSSDDDDGDSTSFNVYLKEYIDIPGKGVNRYGFNTEKELRDYLDELPEVNNFARNIVKSKANLFMNEKDFQVSNNATAKLLASNRLVTFYIHPTKDNKLISGNLTFRALITLERDISKAFNISELSTSLFNFTRGSTLSFYTSTLQNVSSWDLNSLKYYNYVGENAYDILMEKIGVILNEENTKSGNSNLISLSDFEIIVNEEYLNSFSFSSVKAV